MAKAQYRHIVSFIIFIGAILFAAASHGQSPGLIFEPASGIVLDPNSDGYITNTGAPFTANGDDVSEFEGNGWTRFSKIGNGEVLGDQRSGSNEGFTDFSLDGQGYASYVRVDGQNIIFRFRLADFAQNAKGYTVLIDTDGAIGEDDTDSYVAGENPGFELGILLKSKQGVYILDFDASPNDGSCDQIEYSYSLSTNHQKVFGGERASGSLDAFYDFYVPLADLYAAGSITSTTGLRLAGTTNNSNSCSLKGSLADIGGLDDSQYSCALCTFENLVNTQSPTSINEIGTSGIPTACPLITSEISLGSNIDFEGIAASGSEVKLYINSIHEQTTTADAMTGNFSFTIPVVLEGDVIYVTATDNAAGLTESANNCNISTVSATCETGPEVQIGGPPGQSDRLSGTTDTGLGDILDLDFQVRLYGSVVLETGSLTSYNGATGDWEFRLNMDDGDNDFEAMEYEARFMNSDGCWGPWEVFCGQGNAPKGNPPIVLVPAGDVQPGSTINFSGTVDIINTNGTDGAAIYIVQNDELIASVEVAGARNQSGVPWSINNVDIGFEGDVEIYSIPLFSAVVGGCRTPEADKVIINVVQEQSEAPVITGTYCEGSDLITGTSGEPDGSVIRVYDPDSALLGTTTVGASGNWEWSAAASGLSTLAGIYVTAQNETDFELESLPSASLVVGSPDLRPDISFASGTITESASTIQVDGIVSGDRLNVYADGSLILSAVASGTSHTFTLPADYIDPDETLYVGASLTATSGSVGGCQSLPSAPVVVTCDLPDNSLTVIAPLTQACGSIVNATVTIEGSEVDVIYTAFNINDLTTPLGLSKLGDGGAIELQVGSFLVPGAETVVIEARKNSGGDCFVQLASSIEFTVDQNPDISNFSSISPGDVCKDSTASIVIGSSSIADGDYIISYDISAPNTATGVLDTVSFSAGTAEVITKQLASEGATTITLQSITDMVNGCNSLLTINNSVAVNVINCNTPPMVQVDDASINEGVQIVLTAGVIDPDPADSWTYTITGTDEALFDIEPSTGELTFKNAPDFENPLDSDANNVYLLDVTVTDAADASDTKSIAVTVLPVNDNSPILTASDVSIPENAVIVQTVSATDGDAGDVLTFSISGADEALFDIEPSTGELTFKNAPDFENPLDSDANNVYLLDVTVTDAADASDTKSIAVTVLPVNDNSPILTASDVSILENETIVQTVSATDGDAGDVLTFSISGADEALFDIEPSTGELTFKNAPDFENPLDSDANNVYLIDVTVTDAADASDTKLIAVTVLPVNDNSPILTATDVSIPENVVIVQTVTATDGDAGDVLTFSISGADEAFFDIEPSTGELTFKNGPDFENPLDSDVNNVYLIDVIVTDAADASDSKSIAVTVLPVNDNSPILTASDVSIPENETIVQTVSATDGDAGDVLTFSISGADEALFDIEPSTGELTFKNAPDFENPLDSDVNNVYIVDLTVTDAADASDTKSIAITVLPVNDNSPILTTSDVSVPENETIVQTVTATDGDAGDVLVFSISGTDEALFDIEPSTGELTFKNAPDYEGPLDSDANNVYLIDVTVTDAADASDTKSIAVTILPVNDHSPILTASDVSIPENESFVQTVSASDGDAGDVLVFSISGTDEALFDIDRSTGELTFKKAPDFENPRDNDANNIYSVDVIVTDVADQSDTKSIAITILPVNESAPVLTASDVTVVENELQVQTVSAVDEDADDVLTFEIAGLDHTFFEIDPTSGELEFKVAPDFEEPLDAGFDNVYHLVVVVEDEAGNTDAKAISVTVSGINDNFPTLVANNISMEENKKFVQFVEATDEDYGDSQTFSISGTDSELFKIQPVIGKLDFIKAPDFEDPKDAGLDNIYDLDITVTDAVGHSTFASIQVTVTDGNDNKPILSVMKEYEVSEETQIVTQVEFTDPDVRDEHYFSIAGKDAEHFLIDESTGLLQFKVAPLYSNPLDFGLDNIYEIEVAITDEAGHKDAAALKVIVIVPNNLSPIAEPDEIVVDQGGVAKNIDLLANDVDPDGDPLSITKSSVAEVQYGTLVFNSDGTVTYTPFVGYIGDDGFSYEVCDNRGGCTVAEVVITIAEVDDDVDADGIKNEEEGTADADGDGIPNFQDPDSDNDGIPDITEGTGDADSDLIPNYIDIDSDGDGLLDQDEIEFNSLTDCDMDGTPDYLDADRCEVEVAKGFSPNSDGQNDVWQLHGIDDYPTNQVRIFNRWGNLVYQVDGYNNRDLAWTGNSNGKFVVGSSEVPDGTYFYVIELGDGSEPVSGYVVVKR